MTIKEIHAKTGSMTNYVGYVFLVFCWFFLDNRFTAIKEDLASSLWLTLTDWGIRLVIVPLLLAGVFGGIYEKQRAPSSEASQGSFFQAVKKHVLRFLGANLLALIIYMIVVVSVMAARGVDPDKINDHKLLLAFIAVPYSALDLFWLAAIIVERRIWRGLLRALGTLILNPFALVIGLLWGVISFADNFGIDFPSGQFALPIDAVRAAVLAVARVAVIMYAFAIYSQAVGEVAETTEQAAPGESAPGEGLVKASFGFSFVSFLPVLHLVALILGILALQRRKQFSLKAAAACCLGGFFTLYYALMVAGWLVSRSAPSVAPGYAFLTDANRALHPQVTLLEQGSFLEAQMQLEQAYPDLSKRHWTIDSAGALAKLQDNNVNEALEDFRIAAEKNPERAEFYYYYGVALLEDSQEKQAAEQFETALSYDPNLRGAQRYAALLHSTYEPSPLLSGLLYIFILLIFLFPLHEYGHAFAAWKLGDDTAQKQGRLTLNPIVHLELFGSILLPAILIFQQSQFVFGWARPVPVDTRNFKNPQKDHMLVSFAGPAMNLLIAMVSLLLLSGIMLVVHLLWPETLSLNLARPFSAISLVGPPFSRWLILLVLFLKQLFYTSLILGFFNLLPIPPLDGSWIFSGWLPQGLRNLYEKTRQFGFILFILLVVTSVLDYILVVPIIGAWAALQLLVSAMGLG
jgi:Zn-dependent protease